MYLIVVPRGGPALQDWYRQYRVHAIYLVDPRTLKVRVVEVPMPGGVPDCGGGGCDRVFEKLGWGLGEAVIDAAMDPSCGFYAYVDGELVRLCGRGVRHVLVRVKALHTPDCSWDASGRCVEVPMGSEDNTMALVVEGDRLAGVAAALHESHHDTHIVGTFRVWLNENGLPTRVEPIDAVYVVSPVPDRWFEPCRGDRRCIYDVLARHTIAICVYVDGKPYCARPGEPLPRSVYEVALAEGDDFVWHLAKTGVLRSAERGTGLPVPS